MLVSHQRRHLSDGCLDSAGRVPRRRGAGSCDFVVRVSPGHVQTMTYSLVGRSATTLTMRIEFIFVTTLSRRSDGRSPDGGHERATPPDERRGTPEDGERAGCSGEAEAGCLFEA